MLASPLRAFTEHNRRCVSHSLLYAPMCYRLQMGTAPLSDEYIDEIFDQVMEGLLQQK